MTNIPASKIYDVLYSLRNLGLVRIRTEIEMKFKGKKYYKILDLIKECEKLGEECEKLGVKLRLTRGGKSKIIFYANDIRILIRQREDELKRELMFLNKIKKTLR